MTVWLRTAQSWTIENLFLPNSKINVLGFVFSSKSLLSFRREMAQPRLSMAKRGLDSQIRRGVGGGKIEVSHILIIAMS